MNKILYEIYETPGYISELSLNEKELSFFKQAIYNQWISRIYETSHEVWEKVIREKIQIEDYHNFSEEISHQKLWPKKFRILGESFCEKFIDTYFLQ